MEKLVITPLDALEASLGTLLTSLTTTPTFSAAPAAATALLTADDALTSSLTTLKKHQQNYARILRLQVEASRLEDQIKSIIRTCGDLRSEIGAIHPSMLDDSSEDEEGERRYQDVDYKTLLSFSRRLGKYNARAAREAEEDSLRRRQTAKEHAVAASWPVANGIASPAALETTAETGTTIPDNERAWLDEPAVAARAAQGLAFPAAERLRLGMLGQLQYAREQGGEEAVERALARLMGSTLDEDTDAQAMIQPEAKGTHTTEAQGQVPPIASAMHVRPHRPPERNRSVAPLNLDLWNEDEDDD